MTPRRLYRSSTEKVFFGVAGDLGEYFDTDPVLVRLGFVFLSFATLGCAALLYLVLAIVAPVGKARSTGTSDVARVDPPGEGGEVDKRGIQQSSVTQNGDRGISVIALALIAVVAVLFCASLVGSRWPIGLFSWWFNWGAFWAVLLLGMGIVVLLRLKSRMTG